MKFMIAWEVGAEFEVEVDGDVEEGYDAARDKAATLFADLKAVLKRHHLKHPVVDLGSVDAIEEG